MKYKCIASYSENGVEIMKPGDIIVIKDLDLYNVTTGRDYILNYPESVKLSLEIISDEVIYKSTMSDADRFKAITSVMHALFVDKNHDYGNSFEQSLNEEGLAAARIRMGDKWNRFKELSKGKEAKISDESIHDTLIDLANYAIMTIMWMDKQ